LNKLLRAADGKCVTVKRRRWLNWAEFVKSFNCYIRSEELREIESERERSKR